MNPNLEDLKAMATRAGEILRAGFEQPNRGLQLKREIDVVTETDLKSEKYLLEQINTRFPDHHIVAEESGENHGDQRCTWYIDPLDGTSNFAHGLPIFSVSIGYARDGDLTLGVVYDPIRDEMFSAEKGKGAFLNDVPIRAAAQTELRHSMVVTGFPYDRFTSPINNLAFFNAFALKVRSIRRLGSAALDMCYVAAGRFNGYWEFKMESWDIAAGTLIAREAGAHVTKMNGDPDVIHGNHSILAANPGLHDEMFKLIEEVISQPENGAYQEFLAE
ncbi:MAG: inositol monophosphatase [Anaerolineales bacterium]|nr:inositol monophosphatase [Anaerolineales bacterium]